MAAAVGLGVLAIGAWTGLQFLRAVTAHVTRCLSADAAMVRLVALQARPIDQLPAVTVQVDEEQAEYRNLIRLAEDAESTSMLPEDAQRAWAELRVAAVEMTHALEVRRGPWLEGALMRSMGRLRDACRGAPDCDSAAVQAALFGESDTAATALVARARRGVAAVDDVEALATLRVATSTHADAVAASAALETSAVAHFQAAAASVQRACR